MSNRELGCPAWQILESLGEWLGLSFSDFFSYLAPFWCHSLYSPTLFKDPSASEGP